MFRRDEWEVARLLEVPLSVFRESDVVKRRTRTREFGSETVEIDVPYFDIDGEQVWGATAMVLSEFLAVVERS